MTVAPFSAIEPYIISAESAGRNIFQTIAPASRSTASGYFQITDSTWNLAPATLRQGYPTAMSAPFSVQEGVANWLWNVDQGTDWLGNPSRGYAGDPAVIAANNALVAGQTPTQGINPAVTQLLSTNAAATSSGDVPTVGSNFGAPGLPPAAIATGPNGTTTSITGQTTQTGSYLPAIEAWLSSSSANVGIAVLAIVLILIAVWPQARQVVERAAGAAA